ncbi:hypothetical protein [Burkholderia pseudomallei]|uniref:hypothetical protein n=1 Tax=Burkholderia pseudomallei TaxID=28450 RepID=UPI0012AECC98|nr:hypothetical protein [Burkholderia pseudomallei]
MTKERWITSGVIVFILGYAFFAGREINNTPPKSDESATATPSNIAKSGDDAKYERALIGYRSLRNAMRDPDSFVLESALLIGGTGSVCYDYRSRNGFGGMNRGSAVLPSGANGIVTDEMKGFISAWNKYCANRDGTEISAGLKASD